MKNSMILNVLIFGCLIFFANIHSMKTERLIVSGNRDKSIRLWNELTTTKEVDRLKQGFLDRYDRSLYSDGKTLTVFYISKDPFGWAWWVNLYNQLNRQYEPRTKQELKQALHNRIKEFNKKRLKEKML